MILSVKSRNAQQEKFTWPVIEIMLRTKQISSTRKLSWDKNPRIKVIYLGFSQGVTTLIRWMTNIHPRADYLLLWAGSVPDDIILEPHRTYFNSIPTHFFVGDQDPYIKENRSTEISELMERIGMKTQIHSFNGEHKVDEPTLREWVANNLPD